MHTFPINYIYYAVVVYTDRLAWNMFLEDLTFADSREVEAVCFSTLRRRRRTSAVNVTLIIPINVFSIMTYRALSPHKKTTDAINCQVNK